MSSLNVLPSAPQYGETEKLYPVLPAQTANNFRLQKISDIQKELEAETAHYRQVAKNYKRAFTIAHGSAIGLGALTAFLSSVSGIGASVGIPIGGVAALIGLSSTGLTGFSKKLQTKLTKHENSYTLAITKHNTVCELVSKALNDNEITDGEFNLILRALQKNHELRAAIALLVINNRANCNPILMKSKSRYAAKRDRICKKNISSLAAESKLDLKE